jgi:hypothetical protein
MFDDCVRLEDCKTHVKRFCLQDLNPFTHEKELCLFMSFIDFLNKTNVLKRKKKMSFAMVLFNMMHVYLLESPYRVC